MAGKKKNEVVVPAYVGNEDGVDVWQSEKGIMVNFPFSKTMAGIMRAVDGAEFDKVQGAWSIPADKAETLGETVASLRKESVERSNDYIAIKNLSEIAGAALMSDKSQPGATAKISDFIDKERNYIGPIVAANGRFAAQFTGLGDQDGAAFITIHKMEAVNHHLFKGDDVSIKYDDHFRGSVGDGRNSMEKFVATLGQLDQGVTVKKYQDGFTVDFDFNPLLSSRIGRVDGAEFSKEMKAWHVPLDKEPYLARAVADMRREFSSEVTDREKITKAVDRKLAGANVRDAFTKDGQATTGAILAVNDRFVAQHTGREFVALHRTAVLSDIPDVNSKVKIAYEKGKGSVQPKPEQNKSLSR